MPDAVRACADQAFIKQRTHNPIRQRNGPMWVESNNRSGHEADARLFAFEAPHMGTLFKIKLYANSEQTAREAATAARPCARSSTTIPR